MPVFNPVVTSIWSAVKRRLRGGTILGGGAVLAPASTLRTTKNNISVLVEGTAPTFASPATVQARPIIVDPQSTFQPFNGVGACITESTAYCFYNYLNAAQRAALIQKAFVTDGLNMLRVGFGSNDFTYRRKSDGTTFDFWTYDDTSTDGSLSGFSTARDDDYVVPMVKAIIAANPNTRIFASPWSPPAFLKNNNALIGNSNNTFNGTPANYTTYANYFVKAIQAWQAKGIPIYAVSIQNESDTQQAGFPSCQWTGVQTATFIKTYLAPALQAAGLSTKIWISDDNYGRADVETNAALSDASALAAIDGIAYHGYTGTPASAATRLAAYPTKGAHFTEFRTLLANSLSESLGVMVMNAGIGALRAGIQDITLWNLILDQAGNPSTVSTGRRGLVITPSDGSAVLTYAPEYNMLAHLGRYVKRGAVRILSNTLNVDPATGAELTTAGNLTTLAAQGNDVTSVAYLNPDGSIVVMLWNADDTNAKAVTLVDATTGKSTQVAIASREMVTVTYPGTTVGARPAAPTSFTAANEAAGVRLTWAGIDPALPVLISRGLTSGAEPAYLLLPPGTTTYLDLAGLTDGTTYRYVCQSVGGGARGTTIRASIAYSATYTPTAALARDAITTGTGDKVTSVTVNHTVAADANLLVVAIMSSVPTNAGGTTDYPTATSVTAGGRAMTKLDSSVSTGQPGRERAVEVWTLFNPPTGSVAVVASTPKPASAADAQTSIVTAISYKNAYSPPAQTTAKVATTTSGGAATLSGQTTSDNARCEVLAIGCSRSTTAMTGGSGQTALATPLGGTNVQGIVTAQAGGTGVTSSVNWTTADQGALLIVPIRSI